jgi:16S rRNA (cytosine967-C5)-methyltransferase
VRPGGVVVYAVCTHTRDETWEVVETALATTEDLALDPPEEVLPPQAAALTHAGALRTLPSEHDLDGFFAVRLRRNPRR